MTRFSTELETRILERLAEGEALRAICNDVGVPVTESAVRKRAIEVPDFGARYARAREVGYDCRAERAVEDTKSEAAQKNPQAARLRFDAERWYLSKMKPKTYGDKIDISSTEDRPSMLEMVMRGRELARRMREQELEERFGPQERPT